MKLKYKSLFSILCQFTHKLLKGYIVLQKPLKMNEENIVYKKWLVNSLYYAILYKYFNAVKANVAHLFLSNIETFSRAYKKKISCKIFNLLKSLY